MMISLLFCNAIASPLLTASKAVCGVDGNFYDSKCEAIRSGTKVSRKLIPDLASKSCISLKECGISKVCGVNGRVYKSNCQALKGGILISETLAVNDKKCVYIHDGICTEEYNPVCDRVGQIYLNPCLLLTAGGIVGNYTFDSDRNQCTLNHKPGAVCGIDGRVYESKCEAEMNNIVISETWVAMNDYCEFNDPGICTEEYSPVCDRVGQWYPNQCVMNSVGGIPGNFTADENSQKCKYFGAVCDIFGNYYDSANHANQKNAVISDTFVVVDNSCVLKTNGFCAKDYKPVCDRKGQLYENRCVMTKSGGKRGKFRVELSDGKLKCDK